MNKENKYSNLAKWCEQHYERSKIKVHPTSVPVDLVLEDVLSYIAHLRSNVNMLITALDNMEVRYKHIEEQLDMVNAELHTLKSTEKKAKKNDKSTG